MDREKLKRILEAFLFISVEPLTFVQMKDASGEQDMDVVKELVFELRSDYMTSERSLRIEEMAGGCRMTTDPQYAKYVKKLMKGYGKDRLSRASLETLAIAAYKQPVTRGEIEAIRGVNVDRSLQTLQERGLVRIVGRKDTAGRPMLYGTTRLFLDHFGLKTLGDLPSLDQFISEELSEDEKNLIRKKYGEEPRDGDNAGTVNNRESSHDTQKAT